MCTAKLIKHAILFILLDMDTVKPSKHVLRLVRYLFLNTINAAYVRSNVVYSAVPIDQIPRMCMVDLENIICLLQETQ